MKTLSLKAALLLTIALVAKPCMATTETCEPWPHGIECRNREALVSQFTVTAFEDVPYIFQETILTVISHSDSNFDTNNISFPGAQSLIEYSKHAGIKRLALISTSFEFGLGTQAFEQKDVNYVIESGAGQHRLQFPNIGTFLIAGGNLSLCLCEFLRDTIHGTEKYALKNKTPLNFVFVTDAVYDDSTYWPQDLPSILSENDKGIIEDEGSIQFLLSTLIEKSSDSVFSDYIAEHVLGLKAAFFCPHQESYGHDPIDSTQLTFHLYISKNGQRRKVNTIGKTGREINLIFADRPQYH